MEVGDLVGAYQELRKSGKVEGLPERPGIEVADLLQVVRNPLGMELNDVLVLASERVIGELQKSDLLEPDEK